MTTKSNLHNNSIAEHSEVRRAEHLPYFTLEVDTDVIATIDGKAVTEEMLDSWTAALDKDEWPKGWKNVGDVVVSRPPMSMEECMTNV